ncbi:MAG: polysaccharide deacetylase family protein [Bacteroidia bacterium]|nr:polysaccharide deacetylase family protein [Bacteroidia bacterium]
MRFFRPCFIAGWLYPDAIFRIRTVEKLLCLTFDDGPHPDSTPQLLDILDKHDIKTLFFCDGRAAEKYPGLINQIKTRGHLAGNHGYNHLNGWITSLKRYVADVSNAEPYTSTDLFRPPYGRLRFNQYRKLKKKYKIVFWDIMPYDFDPSFGSENSLRILKNKIRPGSIIVLHDNQRSESREYIEEFILFAKEEGYRFDSSIICCSTPC